MDYVKLTAVVMALIILLLMLFYTLFVFLKNGRTIRKKIEQGNFKVTAVEKFENQMDFSLRPYSTQKSLSFKNVSKEACLIEVWQEKYNFTDDLFINYSSWGENWEQTDPLRLSYRLPIGHNSRTKDLMINIAFLETPGTNEIKKIYKSFPEIKLKAGS